MARVLLFISALMVLLRPDLVLADPVGWGAVANDFMTPVDVLTIFVVNACIVLGITFLFATFLKYRQHRVSPLHVPLSTVIFLLILSILILLLPMIHYVLEYLEHAS